MNQGAASIRLDAIGQVRAARTAPEDDWWGGTNAFIDLLAPYDETSIAGIERFSHLEIIYLFHQVNEARIQRGARHPRNNPDWPEIGIFAQRGKNRPNRLGASIVRLLGVRGATLEVAELDAIDGTPVLDIKPVMRDFLPREAVSEPPWCAELMRDYWRAAPEGDAQ